MNIQVPQDIDTEYLKTRVPNIVFINSQIKKCFGCDYEFSHDFTKEPHNMIIKMRSQRERPDGRGGWVLNRFLSNAYFCLRDIACIEKKNQGVGKQHMYMGNHSFNRISKEQKQILQDLGYWEEILRNRRLKSGQATG